MRCDRSAFDAPAARAATRPTAPRRSLQPTASPTDGSARRHRPGTNPRPQRPRSVATFPARSGLPGCRAAASRPRRLPHDGQCRCQRPQDRVGEITDARRSASTNPSSINILVTGTGGPVGISIYKALQQSSLRPRIVATDADPRSLGLFRADAGYVMPHIRVGPAAYLERLQEVIVAEQVSMVCFGSEPEIDLVAPVIDEIEEGTGLGLCSTLRTSSSRYATSGCLPACCASIPYPGPKPFSPLTKPPSVHWWSGEASP